MIARYASSRVGLKIYTSTFESNFGTIQVSMGVVVFENFLNFLSMSRRETSNL
jgi:hypothetical protein